MSIRRDKRYGHWLYRKQIRLADGRRSGSLAFRRRSVYPIQGRGRQAERQRS